MMRRFARTAGFAAAASAISAGVCAVCASEEEDSKKPQMKFRMLGNTGLQVSVLSYGFWATFGSKTNLLDDEGLQAAVACLRTARNGGINLFDNAEVYGNGEAEILMGKAIKILQAEDPVKWRRSDLIITTKIFWGFKGGVNEKGLSRKHIMEGTNAALARLQLDYVDLIFCHRPDPLTPTETVVRAMSDVVRSGKATAWGTSEWSAQQITEAFFIAQREGLEPPSFDQPQYNMMHRERIEREYFPLYASPYKYGLTIWSPLSSGLLTGKYNVTVPEGSRASDPAYVWLKDNIKRWRAEGKIDKVAQLEAYAKEHLSCTMSQLAIAWCVKNPNVSTVLLGATHSQQLEENLAALPVVAKLTPEHMAAIEVILSNAPEKYSGVGGDTRFRSIDTL